MPARVLQPKLNARDPEQVAQVIRRAAAMFDDPIAGVQIEFGTYSGGSRTVTFTAIDRLLERYAPTLFRNARGKSPGRWLITWYMAATEYGTPIDPGISATPKGKTFGQIGFLHTGETDATGVMQVTMGKVGGTYWLHAGIGGLLRSKGIDWISGADAPANTEASDAPVPPVTSFS